MLWFNEKFLWYQSQQPKKRATIEEFANFIEIPDASLGHYMNGRRIPSFEVCMKIAKKLGDYSLLPISGFDLPGEVITFDSLPPETQSMFMQAIGEINSLLKSKNVSNEDEAFKIASEVFASHSLRAAKVK
jgi:DNA-binding XRE family transcriptional regulator